MVWILLRQIVIMVLLAGVGYVMFRTGKISLEGSKTLGNILIFLSLPCVIVKGFLVEKTPERLSGLAVSLAAAAVILSLSMLVSHLFFKKDAIASFAGAFSNPGFFGVPLIVASLSNGSVFYIAAFIAFLNMLQWTYGVSLLTGQKTGLKLKKLVTAPFFIAIVIGLFFFLTGISMPTIVGQSVDFLAGLNTPLAMFTIGVYLAQTDLKKMMFKPVLYLVSLVRLVVIPLVAILFLWVFPADFTELKMAVLIAAACPVGSNVAVYAQLHNNDYGYAVETVVMSTMLSVVTIPLIVQAAGLIWGIR